MSHTPPESSADPGPEAAAGAAATARGAADAAVSIVAADVVDDELVEAFARLIPQLSSSSPPPTRDQLAELVDDPSTVLFLARVDNVIVGSLTLIFYRIPTGLKGLIEDVVVDGAARGKGVGALLSLAALDEAQRRNAKDVSLSSRPSRDAANRLYLRLGFVRRDTNMYRFNFD